jgi:HAD superfamily hydrolase (TIGR01509 family)
VSPEEASAVFPKGGTLAECVATIEGRLGTSVPADFEKTFRAALYDALATEVEPVAGVLEALAAIDVPMCVASNGPLEKIETTLRTIGVFERFEGRVFSAYTLQRFKPLPDLFLHAASSMGVAAEGCTVVEDSVPGVQAAVAARMRVLGYASSERGRAPLIEAGAEPLSSMLDLPGLI